MGGRSVQKCIQEIQTTAATKGLENQANLASYIENLSSFYGTTVFSEILKREVTLELVAKKASADLAQQQIQQQLDTLQQEPLPHLNNGLRALTWGIDLLANLINLEIQAIVFIMEPDHFSRDRLIRAMGGALSKGAAEPLWWITTGLHKKKIETMQEDEKMAILALSVLYDGVGEDALMNHFSQLSMQAKQEFLSHLAGLQATIQAGGKGLLKGGAWTLNRFNEQTQKIETISVPLSPGFLAALQQNPHGVRELEKKCQEWMTIEQKQFGDQFKLIQQHPEAARLPTTILVEPSKAPPAYLYGYLQGFIQALSTKPLNPLQQAQLDDIKEALIPDHLQKTSLKQPLVASPKKINPNLSDRIDGALRMALLEPYQKALALYHEVLRTPILDPDAMRIVGVDPASMPDIFNTIRESVV